MIKDLSSYLACIFDSHNKFCCRILISADIKRYFSFLSALNDKNVGMAFYIGTKKRLKKSWLSSRLSETSGPELCGTLQDPSHTSTRIVVISSVPFYIY